VTGRDRTLVAMETAALTILAEAVKAELDKRRVEVADWPQGAREIVHLPNEDDPNLPIKVAEIRCDGGQKVAAVQDRVAWLAWCQENSPHNVAQTAEGRTEWRLDDESTQALAHAGEIARFAPTNALDPWAPPDPELVAREMLDALEAAGYTLTPVQTIPAETVVLPGWEDATLKASQKEGTPVCPDGQIPDGIHVSTSPGKPYVKVEKPPGLRREWIAHVRETGTLPAALLPPANLEGTD
jgi:hypothetical protein